VRVDQRDHHEERLLLRGRGAQVLQRAFAAAGGIADRLDVAAVVIRLPAAGLVEVAVGAAVRRVPAGEAVLRQILGRGRLAAVPLALVDAVVAGGIHHRGEVRQVHRQLDLGVALGGRHLLLERVLDAVLRRHPAGHQRGAGGRAHARVGERVLEAHAVALEAHETGQVALRPAGREVLDRALLVGQEHEHVHPGGRRSRLCGERARAEQHRRKRRRPGLEQLLAGQSHAAILRTAGRRRNGCTPRVCPRVTGPEPTAAA
jgi:hypothetical protein